MFNVSEIHSKFRAHLDELARQTPGKLVSFQPVHHVKAEGFPDTSNMPNMLRPMHGIYIPEIDRTFEIPDHEVRPWVYPKFED